MTDMKTAEGGSGAVMLHVEPRVCLHDVPTSIRLTGLPPQDPVTLTLLTHNDDGQEFMSYVHYVSDASGAVDAGVSEAVGGSYSGVFQAGLFSTLREFPFKGTRLQKQDPMKPWRMMLTAYKGHLKLEDAVAGNDLADVVLKRYLAGPGVRRTPVRHGRVRGVLFLPAGPGPFPAVIDVFGGFGGLKEYRASMMASKGFACLALAFFGYDDLPDSSSTLDLEYFEESVDFILSQPGVIPDRCGVVSSSKGSNVSLAMGIHLEKVTAVVCIGGLLVGETVTYRGKPLWENEIALSNITEIDDKGRVVMKESRVKEIFQHDHPAMPPCETAPDDTHFLLIAGDQDTYYTKLGVEGMEQRMQIHGRQRQCHTMIYPGAGHIIEPPYSASSDHSTYKSAGEVSTVFWGGEPRGTCKAQEENWGHMRRFLELHVRDTSTWYQQHMDQTHTG